MEIRQTPGDRRVATWRYPVPVGIWGARTVTCRALTIVAWSAPGLAIASLFCGVFASQGRFFLALFVSLGVAAIAYKVATCLEAVRARKEVSSLLEQVPAGIPAMGVRLSLLMDGHRYGEEVGMLALVDGWLIFEGSNTCFSLAPYDIEQALRLEPERGIHRIQMVLAGIKPRVCVKVAALRYEDDPDLFLRDWKLTLTLRDTVSVLPPLEPQPALRRPRLFFDPGWDGAKNLYLLINFPLIVYLGPIVSGLVRHRGGSEINVLQAQTLLIIPYMCVVAAVQEWSWRRAKRKLAACRAQLPIANPSEAVLPRLQQGEAPQIDGASAYAAAIAAD
jgi:hypothetical protein